MVVNAVIWGWGGVVLKGTIPPCIRRVRHGGSGAFCLALRPRERGRPLPEVGDATGRRLTCDVSNY